MTALSIFLISLIQGITEFLPISSSGHLILIPALTGLADQGQTADVAAHFGTLAAVVLYLHRDITKMISSILPVTKTDKVSLRLIGLLVLSSLPVILAGLIIEVLSPSVLRLAMTVALANIFFAVAILGRSTTCQAHTLYKWRRI